MDKDSNVATAKALGYSWHLFFGEKAMLKPPQVHKHVADAA